MQKVLSGKKVIINNFEKEVGIVIKEDLIYGLISGTKFVWNYKVSEVPKLQLPEGVDVKRATMYGRLYILKRLEMDNVTLPIKSKERRVEYIHMETKNGVWVNAFENGYVRGYANGRRFYWHTVHDQYATILTEGNEKSKENNSLELRKACTDAIKARLIQENFGGIKALMNAINKVKIEKQATAIPSSEFLDMIHTEDLVIRYHANRFITGLVNGKEFVVAPNAIKTMPAEVSSYMKSLGITTLNILDDYCNKIFISMRNLSKLQECINGKATLIGDVALELPTGDKDPKKENTKEEIVEDAVDTTKNAVEETVAADVPVATGATIVEYNNVSEEIADKIEESIINIVESIVKSEDAVKNSKGIITIKKRNRRRNINKVEDGQISFNLGLLDEANSDASKDSVVVKTKTAADTTKTAKTAARRKKKSVAIDTKDTIAAVTKDSVDTTDTAVDIITKNAVTKDNKKSKGGNSVEGADSCMISDSTVACEAHSDFNRQNNTAAAVTNNKIVENVDIEGSSPSGLFRGPSASDCTQDALCV